MAPVARRASFSRMARGPAPKPGASKAGAKKPAGGTRPAARARPTLSFSRVNAIWLGAAAAVIAAGYALLATGSTTLAPILLVAGYCVLLPVGIIKR